MLYPTSSPISLEGIHRLFLSAQIPGFWSSQKTICLPLHLDGSYCDQDLSLEDRVPWREVNQVDDYFFRKTHFFANRSPKLKLYPNKKDFERQHRPDWIAQAVRTIHGDLKSYLHVRRSELGPREKLLAPIVERWDELDPIIKGCLYMGSNPVSQKAGNPQSFLIYPQDLFLYGEPLDWSGLEKPLLGLLLFLEALLSVDSQMRTGIAVQVNVMVSPISEPRVLKDPIEIIHDHHNGEFRLQRTITAKKDGSIDWNQLSSYKPSEIKNEYWDDQTQQIAALVGLYLFAENQLSQEEIDEITDKAADSNLGKSKRTTHKFTNWFKNFLNRRPRGIDQRSLDHQVFLMSHSLKRFIMH